MANYGGSIKLTGESEYRKALKEITTNLKLMSSELKLTNTEFASGDKSIKQTKSSYDNMNKALEEQKDKVKNAREELKKMEQQYGANNPKVQEFKTQLNNAEQKLKEMESATDKSTKELKEMKNGFEEAGKGAISFGDILKANVLGDFVTTGIKAIGSAVAEVGKSFVNLGKQALDSYADYEQLVGGVETLFKDSSGIVQEYANNAYKTAGLSANEYMETVTSFSASLLQGLGGDTVKASEYANMAIIDMSDNANKMGTDIGMIQNAYQGFAKQNYTMLDNLKLGYGGTKEEMARLVKESGILGKAGKDLTAKNLDQKVSFDQIVEAIHKVQENMEITGTTSKEASSTISGSVNSMKSAWQNFLTGIADDNANVEQLTENLVDSVITVAKNIIPRIGEIVDGIIEVLPELMIQIKDKLVQCIKDIIAELPPNLQEMANTSIKVLSDAFNGLKSIVETLATAIQNMTKWFNEHKLAIELVASAVGVLTATIVAYNISQAIANAGGIAYLASLTATAIGVGALTAVTTIATTVATAFGAVMAFITSPITLVVGAIALLVAGIVLLVKHWDTVKEKSLAVWGKISDVVGGAINGVKEKISNLVQIGNNMIQGLWQGMSNAKQWLIDKVKGLMSSVTDSIKSFFGIHSPSTLFKDEIGNNLALGLGEGFEDTMKDVTDDMTSSIPTNFDIDTNINGSNAINNTNNSMLNAFKEALASMKIELDDEVAGRFVENTVTELVYS